MKSSFLLHLCLKNSLLANKKCEILDFQALQALSWNIESFLILKLESFISSNITYFFGVGLVFNFFKLMLKSALGDSIIHCLLLTVNY